MHQLRNSRVLLTEATYATASSAAPHSRHARWLDLTVQYGLLALLGFSVLAFGAVQSWATFLFQAGAALLLLTWCTRQVVESQLRVVPNPLYAPVACFGLLLSVQALGLSSYTYATRMELWQYVAYGIVFFLATQLARSRQDRNTFVLCLGVFGFLFALFAIIQRLTSPGGRIFWSVHTRYANVFGSYVNHNHFAAVMEMLAPIPLVLAFDARRPQAQRALLAFMSVFMTASIFLSGSRGGMIAVAAQLAVLASALLRRRSRGGAYLLLGVVLTTVCLLVWMDSGYLLGRIQTLQKPLSDSGYGDRRTIVLDTLRMFRDRPLLGWGLDTFQYIYPRYRSFATDAIVDYAHNDYVQVLAETGILGFGCVLWFLVVLYRSGFRAVSFVRSRLRMGMRFAALLGCTGIVVHSLTDFNLHIPANAAMFYVLAAIACSASKDRDRVLTQ